MHDCTECGDECASCRAVIAQLVEDKRTHIAREVRESQRVEERDARIRELEAQLAAARVERDAYKRAKSENDDRFMTERDEARAELSSALTSRSQYAHLVRALVARVRRLVRERRGLRELVAAAREASARADVTRRTALKSDAGKDAHLAALDECVERRAAIARAVLAMFPATEEP